MAAEAEVLHGLLVLGACAEGEVVLVDVYGSSQNVCGTVRFTLKDARERRQAAATLRAWACDATPLTLVRASSSVALQACDLQALEARP